MLASPTRMNRCLPRLITSSTTQPVRSTVANFGTRTSQRVSVFPASASRSLVAARKTVSPSGIQPAHRIDGPLSLGHDLCHHGGRIVGRIDHVDGFAGPDGHIVVVAAPDRVE